MGLIRAAKPMVVQVATTGIGMVVLILGLSAFLTEGIASEPIPDRELAVLYGGCWFYNPYCIVTPNDCPEHTECTGFEKCRFCVPKLGQLCKDARSYWPDFDGCDDGNTPCENAPWAPVPGIPLMYGECLVGFCVEELWDPTQFYPDCSDFIRNWCDD